MVNGKSVNVPTEDGTKPIFSRIDTGQQVIYTSKGFLPPYLFRSDRAADHLHEPDRQFL